MPEMDGFEVLNEVIKEDPLVPVIVVSGVGVIGDAMEAIRQGAWDYILKPIADLNILDHAIRSSLEKAELIRLNKEYQENLEMMVQERTRKLEEANTRLQSEVDYRKDVEKKLYNSKKMLSSIIETVPDIIYRIDPAGNLNFISDAVENYGLNKSDLLNNSILDYVHPDDHDESYWHLKERRTGNRKTKNYEVRLFQSEKSTPSPVFMLEAEGIYAEKERSFLGTQGIMRDISQRIASEEKVKQSLREKEALLREVHHRVKNNMQVILSMLNLQMRKIDNKKVQEMLLESQNRILSMAMVHESIYNSKDFTHISVKKFVNGLYMQILKTYGINRAIGINYKMDDVYVSLDTAVPLAIILNELFANIFKNSRYEKGKSEIVVEIKKTRKNEAVLIIEDKNCGLPDHLNANMPDSLGHTLINILTLQIEGKLNQEKLEKGTKTIISFNTNINRSSL
jgi:PAS domain S-box-containing protein